MDFHDGQPITVNFPGQVRHGSFYQPCTFAARAYGRDNTGDRIRITTDEMVARGSYMWVPVAWIAREDSRQAA